MLLTCYEMDKGTLVCYSFVLLINYITGSLNENNDYLLRELNQNTALKSWMVYIEKPLVDIADKRSGFDLHNWHKSFHIRVTKLIEWCVSPPSKSSQEQSDDTIHVATFTACGYVDIVLGILPDNITLQISTSKTLTIQITFLVFEMDDQLYNYRRCSHVYLCSYDGTRESHCPGQWVFYGYRKPWIETTDFWQGVINIIQVNVRNSCNVTFTYTAQEREIGWVHKKHSIVKDIQWTRNPMVLVYDLTFFWNVYRWLLKVEVGNRFQFISLKTCCFSGSIELHDGFYNYYQQLLRHVNYEYKHVKYLMVTSEYFQCSLSFHANELYRNTRNNILVELKYIRIEVPSLELGLDTLLSVSNNGGLLHKKFILNSTADWFPNVSFIIRKFEGWSERLCSFGGYVVRHHIRKEYLNPTYELSYDVGPFCSKDTRKPVHFVLGSFQYYLIIYAFGPFFEIDIDIIIHRSRCEGLFEPLIMCTTRVQKQHKLGSTFEPRHFVNTSNYKLMCFARVNKTSNITLYILEVIISKKCIIFQSISLFSEYAETYIFQTAATMTVEASVQVVSELYRNEYRQTASFYSALTISLIDMHQHNAIISNSMHLSYKDVGQVLFQIYNKHQRLYSSSVLIIHSTNHLENCSVSPVENDNNRKQNDTMTDNLIVIFNMCGTLRRTLPSIYIYHFTFPLHSELRYQYYMYLVFQTYFNISTLKPMANILTIVPQLNGASHSVNVLYETMHINHYDRSLVFVYTNRIGCLFDLSYRVRPFLIHTLINYDGDLLKHYLIVSTFVLYTSTFKTPIGSIT